MDYSSALKVFRVSGDLARQVLASGTGIDLRPGSFAVGSSCRTRFAQIAAIIEAVSAECFDLFVGRSFEEYLMMWLAETSDIFSSNVLFKIIGERPGLT
ncbi:MAG: sarcosine oxidase subunit gamma [Candidatus Azotimanducaceae bacterium]